MPLEGARLADTEECQRPASICAAHQKNCDDCVGLKNGKTVENDKAHQTGFFPSPFSVMYPPVGFRS